MPDPLAALPCELWTMCIEHAIDGQPAGPLGLLMVSARWARMLLNTPSLWCQIYIQNGEEEMARISSFLHLSKRRSLHVDIMTVLPTTDSLQLITEHISRVTAISIRPGASGNIAGFPIEQWKQAASNIMSILSSSRLPPSVADTSCFGISLREDGQCYYRVILMEFAPAFAVASCDDNSASLPDTGTGFRRWEEHIASCIHIPANEDIQDQSAAIDSIIKVASYARHHDAIRIAIPSFIKLLEDDHPSFRSTAIKAIHTFAVHIEPFGAISVVIPQLISLLHKDYDMQAVGSVIDILSKYDEFQEPLRVTIIPSLVKLLHDSHQKFRRNSLSVIGKLATHANSPDMLRVAIPSLVELLHHSDVDIRRDSLSVIEDLVEYDKSLDVLRVVIPSFVELLHHRDTAVQKLGIIGLQNIANRNQFHELLRAAIPSVVELLYHRDIVVRVVAFTAIQRLAVYDEFHEALSVAIPFIAPLLKPGNSVQSAVASVMPEICGYRTMS